MWCRTSSRAAHARARPTLSHARDFARMYDASCQLIRAAARTHGDAFPSRFRQFLSSWRVPLSGDARHVARLSLNWTAGGVSHVLRLLSGTTIHVIGDSLADNLRYALAASLACPHGVQSRWEQDDILFPSFDVAVDRLNTHFLVAENRVAAPQATSGWYIDGSGQRKTMRPKGSRIRVFFNLTDLGGWAKPSLYASRGRAESCKLVIMVVGHWFHPRSDVDAFGRDGRPLSRSTFSGGAYTIALQRAMSWLDEHLDRRALVAWLSYSPFHSDCSRQYQRNQSRCYAARPADTANRVLARHVYSSRQSGRTRSAKSLPKHVMINVTEESACWAPAHVGCFSAGYKSGHGSNDGLHWALPGVPDMWVGHIFRQLHEHAKQQQCGGRVTVPRARPRARRSR